MTQAKAVLRAQDAGYTPALQWPLVFIALMSMLMALVTAPITTAVAERVRPITEITSPGGVRAWLVEERAIPLVALRFAFIGGALQDPDGREGVTAVMASLLTEGAGPLSSEAFARELAATGARLSVSAGRDRVSGGLDTLSNRFTAASDLLRLVLTAPTFEAAAIERVRGQHLSSLAIAAEEPRAVALERFYAEAFPNHRLGRPVGGRRATVEALTEADIRAQHRRLLARGNLRVVIVGDIDHEAATNALDRMFGALPASPELIPADPVAPRVPTAPVVVSRPLPAATATFALAALPVADPDYPALQVLNQILASGDFDSRLMEEIRIKRGLAYSVQARLTSEAGAPLWLGGLATRNESMGEALGVLRDVLAATARDGPTREQFANAQQYLVGSYLLDFDTNAGMAAQLLRVWLAGHDADYVGRRNGRIEQVTLSDVRRVAGKVLLSDALIVTIVGQPTLAP